MTAADRAPASGSGMRILYVTNGFPYPLTSGYLRHYFLIRELSRRHAVSLLSIVGADFRQEHASALAPFTSAILTFASTARSRSLRRKAVARLRTLVLGRGTDDAVRQLVAAARALHREAPFDLLLVSGKRTYPVVPALAGIPVVADLCDATSSRIRGSLRYAHRLQRPLLWLDYAAVRRAERSLMAEADALLFASARDLQELLGSGAAATAGEPRATVVPNGVDLAYWVRGSPELGRDAIVFTGAMDYPPNEDAALFLVETILPLVWAREPRAQLWIVGRDPTRRLLAAGGRVGVTVTGFVDDVRPYLERAAVFAAPLRFGAGIQNKVLEAMAMEVPVVASPIAADGLRTEDGRDPPVAIGRTAEELAGLLAARLAAVRGDPTPDRTARAFVEAHFDWARSAGRLERVLQTVARG